MENNETMNVTEIVDDSVKDTDVTDLTVIDSESGDESSNIAGMVVLATVATIGAVTVAKTTYKYGKKGFNWAKEKIKGLKKDKLDSEAEENSGAIDGEFTEVEEEVDE